MTGTLKAVVFDWAGTVVDFGSRAPMGVVVQAFAEFGVEISVAEARIRATRSERIMIVELSGRRAIDFSKSADPMRYTNHSCSPNARLCIRQGRVEFYALRDIAPGEEITVDYGLTHHEGRLRCRCNAPACRGAL
jgi:SET domain-containing protein